MPSSVGPRRDGETVIVTLLRTTASALAIAQIAARTGLSVSAVTKQLHALEAAGRIGRIAGKPQRWYWRADSAQGAAD